MRTSDLIEDAYILRNIIAHGRNPSDEVEKAFVINFERCVRCAIRRAIGLAISQDIHTKEDLQQAIGDAKNVDKTTGSKTGTQQLRKNADAPFF
jgi:hypothetical protein